MLHHPKQCTTRNNSLLHNPAVVDQEFSLKIEYLVLITKLFQ